MPIPPKIHFCWFGNNKFPPKVLHYMDSWKNHCPTYEFICWNESNSPLGHNQYVRQSFDSKKWAFVSDYVRLYALYTCGGIYLDTDVELLKPLDPFLVNSAFYGLEEAGRVATCVIGAEEKHPIIKQLLQAYDKRSFIKTHGSMDMTTNVEATTELFLSYGLKITNSMQSIQNTQIYPTDYFSPKDLKTGQIQITKNTVAIHHFQASWMSSRQRINTKIAQWIGPENTQKIKKVLKHLQ